MKKIFFPMLFSIVVLFSCQDDSNKRQQDIARNDKKNEQIFSKIDKAWDFTIAPSSPTVQNLAGNWTEWRLFKNELEQKPKSSIGAFKQKARTLSKKVTELNSNIPSVFDKPEIRSRLMTLGTKIKSLDLYINLDYIPQEKVLKLIPEVNYELASLQGQMEKIVKKSQIRLEEGEAEMIRSLGRDSLARPVQKIPSQDKKPKFEALQTPAENK